MHVDQFQIVHNRQAFEAALRKHIGQEYVIVGEPQQIQGAPPGHTNGMWVIRKQDRIRQDRQDDPNNPYPEIETLATHFMIGERVYQAPSVADVVGNRVLSAATSLSKFFEKAASLPSFSPTTGHSYLPQTAKPPTGTASATGSPARSREGSIAPGLDTQSLRSGSLVPESQDGGKTAITNVQDARMLAQSLQMAIQFGDEYMDENPLLGEPGSFKFTSSTAAVKKRKADEEAATLAAAKAKEQKEVVSRPLSPKPEKAPSPPAIFTDARSGQPAAERQKKDEKKKRKKSRPNVQTPTTPASATNTQAPLPAG